MISPITHRESLLVELVDQAGNPLGQDTVDAAHRAPGRLHRAFSVLLVDQAGRLLLQRRSAVKTRFPLRWANACCGHPAPGEPITDAAGKRLSQEIDVHDVTLTEVGVYVYRAGDPATGRIEHEYDHVLLGQIDPATPLRPDPDEVADLRWIPAHELPRVVAAEPDAYAPWLAGVAATLAEHRLDPTRAGTGPARHAADLAAPEDGGVRHEEGRPARPTGRITVRHEGNVQRPQRAEASGDR